MQNKNTQAIANIQLEIALRLNEKNWLQKIIGSEHQPDYVKSAAQDNFAKLAADHQADIRELERPESGKVKMTTEPT